MLLMTRSAFFLDCSEVGPGHAAAVEKYQPALYPDIAMVERLPSSSSEDHVKVALSGFVSGIVLFIARYV